jgi:uncharacterized protein (DUF2267 family)
VSAESEQFFAVVARKAKLPHETAERAAQATLETLAERLSKGEARDLAEQLPPELAPWLGTDGGAEPFDVDEFLRRVARRAGTDLHGAERAARAVFAALGSTVSREEVDDVAAELPKDFAPLVAEAQRRFDHVMPAEELLRRVAERAGLDVDGARQATDAVLETLAERIAGGEVKDLIASLSPELHPPLRKGNELSHGAARPMSVDEFVRRVAEREGVTPPVALEHARVVFATLREALPEKEFFDVTAQLPSNYAAVTARP